MTHSRTLLQVSKAALLTGLLGVSLAACSGGGSDNSPFPTPTPGPTATPTPTPTPTPTSPPPPPPPVPASQAASQLGSGFNMAYTEPPLGTPYDADQLSIAELTAQVDPIDITNP
ncbi:hypothetical protein [Ponticaulis sp.]|uniref:hypothetical protein n=1 Tax=Ponticaulis sp. TaxID=2020902 RepID=UPI000C895065|nr:hypothetical protein [Ponticaulis sp.]MAI90251.1 hypothetical protein [Ponticaulis sp.]|tara:strand:+ start:229008 stop:229352 length:345 start_codon:yes stop_codon:yes gene_type:complete